MIPLIGPSLKWTKFFHKFEAELSGAHCSSKEANVNAVAHCEKAFNKKSFLNWNASNFIPQIQ